MPPSDEQVERARQLWRLKTIEHMLEEDPKDEIPMSDRLREYREDIAKAAAEKEALFREEEERSTTDHERWDRATGEET